MLAQTRSGGEEWGLTVLQKRNSGGPSTSPLEVSQQPGKAKASAGVVREPFEQRVNLAGIPPFQQESEQLAARTLKLG